MIDELFLYRDKNTALDCPGLLVFKNNIVCHTLEDIDRDLCMSMTAKEIRSKKIYGQTAIPYGRYKIKFYDSPKLKERVVLLLKVKGFSYVEIHPANWAYELEGCIAPGLIKDTNTVLQSRDAMKVVKKLITDEKIEYINILKMVG